jgi:peptidoglycan hydrolase-like protein with peptidoglycan-binding domain
MKYGLPLFLIAVLAASMALPQSNTPAAKKAQPAPKTAATTKKKGKSAKKPVAANSLRSRQMAPTPDRYREIQQALIDKGYLKSEANGVWDTQSEDALRQFQTERNLSPTGKLSAASLIALGLGPKTSADLSPPPPATATPAPIETPPAAPPED